MASANTPRLTAAAYISGIIETVNEYKDVRDLIEKMFDELPGLPDTCLSSVGEGLSDAENLKAKRKLYRWTTEGGYPPYLEVIPDQDAVDRFKIFDPTRFAAVQAESIPGGIGQFFSAFGESKPTMASIEKRYHDLRKAAIEAGQSDVYTAPNVGLRSDWYTDAVFAQQHFTGVNPTGLKQASRDWIEAFVQVASDQKNTAAHDLLTKSPSSLYVVDNSDYRYLLGVAPDTPIVATGGTGQPAFGCSSVTLFTLSNSGKLHPVAICLDYKGSLEADKSVTIFNKRLTPDTQDVDEKVDWPWRYAKMAASVSDWARHELAVHLTETHLVEEASIIAAQRNFPDSHIISQLLHPHWYKTLSLNFLARLTLIPVFIEKVAPLQLGQIKDYVRQSYVNFDFTGRYVPNDLKSRGFDPSKLEDKKFHNYLYARNISKCWDVLRDFVSDVLHAAYPCGDADVLADKYVSGFSAEMRSLQGGQLPSFPRVKTLDELIDMVTMLIHIAAPQHTAVNYLQQFYLSFVPNRPGSLAAALPVTLEQLQGYTEDHVVASLPISGIDRVEWMLMALVPYLLSAEVDPESNIEDYAESTKASPNTHIAKAGVKFSRKIHALKATFDKYNEQMDDHVTPYHVLDPKVMAQSILI